MVPRKERRLKRYHLTQDAFEDLAAVDKSLDLIAPSVAQRFSEMLEASLQDIAENPFLGLRDTRLTHLLGSEVRSRLVSPYRVFYRIAPTTQIIAIIHGAQNVSEILRKRFR